MLSSGNTHFDLGIISLYIFWAFFAALIYYLHQESKREGYPLEREGASAMRPEGFPGLPDPKTYILPHGAGTHTVPNGQRDTRPIKARAMEPWAGAPLVPTGNPMLDGVGPASYAERANVPDLTVGGKPRIVPLRVATDYHVDGKDPDPRGMPVIAGDGKVGGTVRDVWVDRSEALIRYLEVEVGQRRVLLPINFARIQAGSNPAHIWGFEWLFNIVMPGKTIPKTEGGKVKVNAILSAHFADVPATASADQVTRREEDRIMGYYGGGCLYATPERAEPVV